MTSGVRSAVVASGTLGAIPLAHALVYIRNNTLSGVLELRASKERHAWLVFSRGLVVSSMTTPVVARFGAVLYELGLIESGALDAVTRDSLREKRPVMELLVERRTITEAQRDTVLAEQTARRILHLFTLPPTTTFSFRDGKPSTSQPLVSVDPIASVWRGLCEAPPLARIGEVLGRVGDQTLRAMADVGLQRANLTPNEQPVCQALARRPMSLAELRSRFTLPRSRIDLLAYLLIITKSVALDSAERLPTTTSTMWARAVEEGQAGLALAPADATAAPSAGRTSVARMAAHPTAPRGPLDFGADEIRRWAAGIGTETPFMTLGLAEGASAEAARAAYFRLARLWNPARLPAQLEMVRGEVARIFVHMTQAHTLLTDPAARPAVVSRSRG